MRKWIDLCENTGPVVLYHITDEANFALNPEHEPQDNSISLHDRSGHKGIYLARDVEKWVNGHGYIRPFVAEIYAEPSALEYDTIGRWGGEVFVPASQFDKLTVNRVMPIDAHCREEFGGPGWIESSHGQTFDTEEPVPRDWPPPYRGYRFNGDARKMSPEEVQRLRQHFETGYENRLNQR